MALRRGFNLIELAVASAMAGVIGVAAIGAFANLNRQLVNLQAESTANDSAKSLIDLLITDMQGVGGGAIRPWMAVWVENGATGNNTLRDQTFNPPAGSKSDRVTFATLIEAAPTCRIKSMNATTLTSDAIVTGSGTVCCLDAMFKNGGVGDTGTTMLAYLVTNTKHRQVALEKVGTCDATVSPGPLHVLDNTPGSTAISTDSGFANGQIVAARVRTIFLEGSNLQMFSQVRNFTLNAPSLDDGNVDVVAGAVFDFQIQLGYDTEPNGRIADTNDTNDEWLFNVATELSAAKAFEPTALRMIGVGAIVGVRVNNAGLASTARIVGGTPVTRDGAWLRAAMGRASLRNLFVFN